MKIKYLGPLFLLAYIILLPGVLFKIQHWPMAGLLLSAGFVLNVIFVISAIVEVVNVKRISGIEKAIWIVGLMFFTFVTGLVYLFIGRKKAGIT